MKTARIEDLTVLELVGRFENVVLALDKALAEFRSVSFCNKLIEQINAIQAELKSRPGDQRHELVSLLKSSNLQVKVNTARAVLSIAYEEARSTLEFVKALGVYPEAANAAETLSYLEKEK